MIIIRGGLYFEVVRPNLTGSICGYSSHSCFPRTARLCNGQQTRGMLRRNGGDGKLSSMNFLAASWIEMFECQEPFGELTITMEQRTSCNCHYNPITPSQRSFRLAEENILTGSMASHSNQVAKSYLANVSQQGANAASLSLAGLPKRVVCASVFNSLFSQKCYAFRCIILVCLNVILLSKCVGREKCLLIPPEVSNIQNGSVSQQAICSIHI